ncbi:VTT domain-containing protein [Acuticoccus sp. M5D2P5]|uniref:DedA family protein n=1 Tax=Acuticoccus kalidii TaxID=2910977 RepID=UPI001F20673B|nr:VTT domain-containing protein [Acuticoccus kalidii]MCF3934027.1 VTT domain-containing protein [Acuticoccus kalidii]
MGWRAFSALPSPSASFPSSHYGLLLAVGFLAEDGAFGVPAAIAATTLGSVAGCAGIFLAVSRLGETRSRRLVAACGRWCGLSPERIDSGIDALRRRQTMLSFALQLVPTVRLFAPAFTALLGARPLNVLAASAVGIAIWNALFIVIGFATARWIGPTNITSLTLMTLGALLTVEVALLWCLGKVRAARNRAPDPGSPPRPRNRFRRDEPPRAI